MVYLRRPYSVLGYSQEWFVLMIIALKTEAESGCNLTVSMYVWNIVYILSRKWCWSMVEAGRNPTVCSCNPRVCGSNPMIHGWVLCSVFETYILRLKPTGSGCEPMIFVTCNVLSFFLFLLQTNLRRFIECVQQLETDKVEKMLDRGLDPNYHDPENGGTTQVLLDLVMWHTLLCIDTYCMSHIWFIFLAKPYWIMALRV